MERELDIVKQNIKETFQKLENGTTVVKESTLVITPERAAHFCKGYGEVFGEDKQLLQIAKSGNFQALMLYLNVLTEKTKDGNYTVKDIFNWQFKEMDQTMVDLTAIAAEGYIIFWNDVTTHIHVEDSTVLDAPYDEDVSTGWCYEHIIDVNGDERTARAFIGLDAEKRGTFWDEFNAKKDILRAEYDKAAELIRNEK